MTRSALRLTLTLLALASTTLAQQNFQTLLVGVDHRTVTSLNGDWHYLVDQSPGRALYSPHGEINDKSYALNTHPNISSGPAQRGVRLRHRANTQSPRRLEYPGPAALQLRRRRLVSA